MSHWKCTSIIAFALLLGIVTTFVPAPLISYSHPDVQTATKSQFDINVTPTPINYLPVVIKQLNANVTPEPSPTPGPTPTPLPTVAPSTNNTPFGIDVSSIERAGKLVAEAGTTWIRGKVLPWSRVEPTEGARNWTAIAALDAELILAARLGLKVILNVGSTPEWAQKYVGSVCGPIRSNKLQTFARFLHDAVARYSAPPYKVKYWELGNEQDLPVVYEDPGYGCWGESSDPFYGGGYYAQMLKAVYADIKSADPDAQVLIGGLAMDCNPRYAPPEKDCKHVDFFEGILAGGGGPYFDGVSFHAYDYYFHNLGMYGDSGWNSAWDTTGPALHAKALFLKDLMNEYGIAGKFMMITEIALLCYDCEPSVYDTTKSYYVAQVYASAISEGITGIVWHTLLGYQGSELVDANLQPKSAFRAYQISRVKLGSLTYAGKIAPADVGEASGVAGYKFTQGGKETWLIWMLHGGTETITLPRQPDAITDAVGASITPTATLTLSIAPIYVEWGAN